MFQRYLITGGTGFLGRAVTRKLTECDAEIYALVLKNDPLVAFLPESVSVVYGDVCDDVSLDRFFLGSDRNTCVIHCAGIVSVASHPGVQIYRVNVSGTNNVLRHCEKNAVGKLIYVSSVHAIPEKPKGMEISENTKFSPDMVRGDYAKSKAIATALVFDAASRGLNASVVFPSGIIGPGDIGKGSITHMLSSYLAGKLPLAVKGGYDFVDVRDVADGIIACASRGERGRGYILSGQFATIRSILDIARNTLHIKRKTVFLPLWFAKLVAPFYEQRSLSKGDALYFTPYSVSVLASNCRFTKAAATALGYSPRALQTSIRDAVSWLKNEDSFPAR